jgi:probable HAF family extracellular repeat protein
MDNKSLQFIAILALACSASQSQMSIAQSIPDRSAGRPYISDISQTANSAIVSTTPTTQGIGAKFDAAAQKPAKQKTYKFRSIDYPGAYRSYASDFGDGIVVGRAYSTDTSGAFYCRGTSYYPVNVPGAYQSQIEGINSSGRMVGYFADGTGDHGFIYDGKSVTTLDVPGAVTTAAYDINDAGVIVGQYDDSSNSYGFQYKTGNFTTITFPGGHYTVAYGINSNGEIVGYYTDSVGAGHGFLLSNGVYSSFDFPDAYATFAYGINDAGAIAGGYDDLTVGHGFIFSGGVFRQVDVPGAATTALFRIRNNGNVVGIVADSFGEYHGVIGK